MIYEEVEWKNKHINNFIIYDIILHDIILYSYWEIAFIYDIKIIFLREPIIDLEARNIFWKCIYHERNYTRFTCIIEFHLHTFDRINSKPVDPFEKQGNLFFVVGKKAKIEIFPALQTFQFL